MSSGHAASLNDWRAINLELIAFTPQPAAGMTQQWLEQLTGDPGESLRKRNERIDNCNYRGASMRLTIDLLRVRWAVGPSVELDPAQGFPAPPDLGDFATALDWFDPLMQRWLREFCPPTTRLAFIAKLAQWTENRVESYKTLGKFLHSVDVDPQSTDFQFRVNRKRSTNIAGGMLLNRLATWNAVTIGMQMQVSAGGNHPRLEGNEFHGCMLQLDINTPAERTEALPHDDLVSLWVALVQLGTEIAEQGDVA